MARRKAQSAPAQAAPAAVARTPMTDTLFNLLSGMGGTGDKGAYTQFIHVDIAQNQLEAAYRNDWIARKIIDIPAQDATREWRSWQAERADITSIEAVEKLIGLKSKTKSALQKARLYGGGALVLGVNQGNPQDELNLEAIKKGDLKFVHAVSRHELIAGDMNRDLMSPFYGHPIYYERNTGGNMVRLHPSRVVRFIGLDYPNEQNATDTWGDSVLQVVQQAIKGAGSVAQGIAQLVEEAKLDIIKIPELTANIKNVAYENKLKARFGLASNVKSIYHMLLLDKEEEWERIEQNFSALPDIIKIYMLIASGAADIPATRLLGQAPVGMNATGESDMRNYYDRIATEQETVISPAMAMLDEVLVRSALGSLPPDLFYEWVSLWQLDDTQRADLAYKKAQTFQIDVQSGVMSSEALRQGRENQLIEDGFYPGFEASLEETAKANEEAEAAVAAANAIGATPGEDVAKTALNGAQITSMLEIVNAVSSKEIPAETGKALLANAFPEMDATEINAIIDPLATFSKPAPAAPPVPFGPRPPGFPLQQPPADDDEEDVTDAQPRTLYVRRQVLNWQAIAAHYKAQGFATTLGEDMHVTIAYSRQPVDWTKAGEAWGQDEKGQMQVKPGGMRQMAKFGDAAVLLFVNNELSWRWCHIKEATGASWDWPDYQPHITISYTGAPEDLAGVEPYIGAIVLGPEIFEEITEDFKEQAVEDGKTNAVFKAAPTANITMAKAIADSLAKLPAPQVNVTVPVSMPEIKDGKRRIRVTKRDQRGRVEEFEQE